MIKEKYRQHKETIHNFTWRSLQIFGKQGITFLIFIICAKLLDPYTFGIYNYILAIVFFLVMFGDFGISTATSKYVAEYNVTDKEKLKSVLFSSGILILGLTVIVMILTLIFGKYFLGDKYIYVLYTLSLIFLIPLSSLYDGIYRGLKRFKQLAIISIIIGIISLSFVYVLIKQYGLVGALIAQNLFYLILVLGLGVGYREFKWKADEAVMKKIGKYSFIIGLGSVGFILYSRIDVLFLGAHNFIEEIGYYEIVNKLLMILLVPFSIIAQVIGPNITQHYANKNTKLIIEKFKKYLLLSLVLSLFLVLVVYLSKNYLLETFLVEYNTKEMHTILNLMLLVFFTQTLNGIIPLGFVMATGHAKLSTYFLVIFGIFHVLLNYFFINLYGFIGIIYSIILTKCTADLLFIFVYYRILRNKK